MRCFLLNSRPRHTEGSPGLVLSMPHLSRTELHGGVRSWRTEHGTVIRSSSAALTEEHKC